MSKLPGENKVWSVITDIIDVIYAGLLWLICSLPVLTIGASSCALYYSIVKCIRHERGRISASFFSAFRSNFRQSFVFTIIYLLYIAIWYFNSTVTSDMQGLFHGLMSFMIVPALIPLPWLFAYISRFENSMGNCFKFTLYLSIRNIAVTLLLLFLLALTAFIGWMIPQLIPLLPGAVCLFMSYFIEPVFKKITAEMEGSGDQWYNE